MIDLHIGVRQCARPPPRKGSTIDREIFALKIICVKNFRVTKFSWFRSIRKIFLTVDDYNMDESLESSWRLVYYQVSGEPGITDCSHRSDIYLGGVRTCAGKLIHWSLPCNYIFHVLNFCGWSRPWNYFNSEMFGGVWTCAGKLIHRSSAIQHYKHSDAIEIRNGIIFNFYTGLSHIY